MVFSLTGKSLAHSRSDMRVLPACTDLKSDMNISMASTTFEFDLKTYLRLGLTEMIY